MDDTFDRVLSLFEGHCDRWGVSKLQESTVKVLRIFSQYLPVNFSTFLHINPFLDWRILITTMAYAEKLIPCFFAVLAFLAIVCAQLPYKTTCYTCNESAGTRCTNENPGEVTYCWVPNAACEVLLDVHANGQVARILHNRCGNTTGGQNYCLITGNGFKCYCTGNLCNDLRGVDTIDDVLPGLPRIRDAQRPEYEQLSGYSGLTEKIHGNFLGFYSCATLKRFWTFLYMFQVLLTGLLYVFHW